MNKQKFYKGLILLVAAALVYIYYKYAFLGFFGYDDIRYARISKLLIEGQIDFTNHYSYRWTVIYPTALSYLIFGVNYLSTLLPFMVYTLLIVILVFYFVKHLSLISVGIAITLTLLCNFIIYYSIRIGPDIPFAFFVTLLIYILFLARFKYNGKNTKLIAFLFSTALMMAFMTKGIVVLILPYLFILFIVDILKKNHLQFWIFTSLFLFSFLSIYLFYDWLHSGDFFGRINSIAKNSYLNTCSYGFQPTIIVVRRILYQFLLMMINKEMIVGFMFLIPIYISKRGFNFSVFEEIGSFLLASVIILWFSANFMSISILEYNPMCLHPRHYLYLIPITAVTVGYYFEQFLASKKLILIFTIVAFLFTILTYFSDREQAVFYLLFTFYGLSLIFFCKSRYKRILAIVLLILILLIPVAYRIHEAKQSNYRSNQQKVTEFIKSLKQNSIIVSDFIQQDINTFNLDFSLPKNITLINFNGIDSSVNQQGYDIYIIDNKNTQAYFKLSNSQMPLFLQYGSDYKHLIYSDFQSLSIFKMDTIILEPEMDPIFESTNYFELNSIENWNSKKELLDSIVVYSEPFSEKVIDTSSTFYINLNNFSYCNNLLLKGNVEFILYDKSNIYFEIIIKNRSGDVQYKESINVENSLKAYGYGLPFPFQLILKKEFLVPNNILQLYVINQDNHEMYIDDFAIKLYDLK